MGERRAATATGLSLQEQWVQSAQPADKKGRTEPLTTVKPRLSLQEKWVHGAQPSAGGGREER
eukprot:1156424-Pelagomonas_calceolata.AAC.2